MKYKNAVRHKVEVIRYAGTNEIMNRLMDDETVWIVQGAAGRRPIIADSEEEAVEYYLDKFYMEEELNSSEDYDVD